MDDWRTIDFKLTMYRQIVRALMMRLNTDVLEIAPHECSDDELSIDIKFDPSGITARLLHKLNG